MDWLLFILILAVMFGHLTAILLQLMTWALAWKRSDKANRPNNPPLENEPTGGSENGK